MMNPILSNNEYNMAKHIYKASKFCVTDYEIAEYTLKDNDRTDLHLKAIATADTKRCLAWTNEVLTNQEQLSINDVKYVSYRISHSSDVFRNYKVQGTGIKKVMLCFNSDIIYEGVEGPSEPFPMCSVPYGCVKLFVEVDDNFKIDSVSLDCGFLPGSLRKKLMEQGPMYMEQYKCVIDKGTVLASDVRRYEYKVNTDLSSKRTVKTVHDLGEGLECRINLEDPLLTHKEITNICVEVEKDSVEYVCLSVNGMVLQKNDRPETIENHDRYNFKLAVCSMYGGVLLTLSFKERKPHTVELTRDYNLATEIDDHYILPRCVFKNGMVGLTI